VGGNSAAFCWLFVGGCGWRLLEWNSYRDEMVGAAVSSRGRDDVGVLERSVVPTFDQEFDGRVLWLGEGILPFWLLEIFIR